MNELINYILICNSTNNHSPSCPSYRNNQLKGASAITNNSPKKILTFDSNEVQLISKVLEMGRFYISKNQNQFQQPVEDILSKINQSLQILNRSNNSLKGASTNISECQKKQALKNILKLLNLT